MEIKEKNRLIIVFLSISFLFLVILAKAFYVQVINKSNLVAYSKSQIVRESKVYPNRGHIYDRKGSPLAINIQTYSIFTIPRNISNNSTSFERLAAIVPSLTLKKIKKKIQNRKVYTWLARKIPLSDEQVLKIKELGKKSGGIYIEAVPKRLYPNHELLAQTIGFVGVDNIGLAGLEYNYDKQLRGEAKLTKYFKDAKGRPVKFEGAEIDSRAQDLHLTIDKELQAIAEKTLKEGVIKHEALKGGIGVIDAKTGEVLAIANYPTFDPNIVRKSTPDNRKLSFVSDPFEPGSIFKTLTVISALENKMARPDTNYYCERGELLVENHYINEAGLGKKFEWLSVSDIIKFSSNIGTTKIAFDLTFPKLKKTLTDFGVGKKTGIEVPGESRGIFTDEENITPLSLSNISFGQGVATTGIQVLAAYAAIVNGGVYNAPTIIKGSNEEKKGHRIVSEQTANEMMEMLVKAVEEGTGTNALIPHFRIGGKTSTAQRPGKSGSYEGYVPGFIGFPTNVENKFVIYVYVDHPGSKEYYGNLIAAPIFKEVAQYILYKNKDFGRLLAKKSEQKIELNEKIVDKVKLRSTAVRVVGKNIIPNFLGLDKISSCKLGRKLKLNLKHKGIGVVSRQHPATGELLTKDTVVELIYTPPTYE